MCACVLRSQTETPVTSFLSDSLQSYRPSPSSRPPHSPVGDSSSECSSLRNLLETWWREKDLILVQAMSKDPDLGDTQPLLSCDVGLDLLLSIESPRLITLPFLMENDLTL